jgi:hypothetical protein
MAAEAMDRPAEPPPGAVRRLAQAQNLWVATVRPDGWPHLVPIWFVWHEPAVYVCTSPDSVKARNLQQDDRVVLALEDGANPLICEGRATAVPRPWPAEVLAAFARKYDWSIDHETEYTRLLRILPARWLTW